MERWKDIAGFEGKYRVSDLGRVYSIPRSVCRGTVIQPIKGRILSTYKKKIRNDQYRIVQLCDKTRTKSEYVHRLVALAFVPNPDNMPEVNHKNLDKFDNKASNLEWTDRVGNIRHARNLGVDFHVNHAKGESIASSKLKEDDVLTIRRLAKKGWTRKKLAKRFKVTTANIGYIVRRKVWKHV
jgi:hypothetical protein